MNTANNPFRLNVGFITKQSVGYSRVFPFDFKELRIPPDVKVGYLKGQAHISRTPQGLLVQTQIEVSVLEECVRCLNLFDLPLQFDFTELYAFSQRTATESELILPKDGHINLQPIIREYIYLSFPISPICSEECKGLCPTCGNNLNEETCNHEDEQIDPRLEKLKTLLDKS